MAHWPFLFLLLFPAAALAQAPFSGTFAQLPGEAPFRLQLQYQDEGLYTGSLTEGEHTYTLRAIPDGEGLRATSTQGSHGLKVVLQIRQENNQLIVDLERHGLLIEYRHLRLQATHE